MKTTITGTNIHGETMSIVLTNKQLEVLKKMKSGKRLVKEAPRDQSSEFFKLGGLKISSTLTCRLIDNQCMMPSIVEDHYNGRTVEYNLPSWIKEKL